MPRLDHDRHTLGLGDIHQGLGDLARHPLLELEAVGEHVDQPRDLAQADDAAPGHVGDVRRAEEGQHVMLAEAEEGYLPDEDHLVVLLVEERVGNGLARVQPVALGQETQRAGHAPRCLDEPGTGGILTQLTQQRLDELGQGVLCEVVADRGHGSIW